MPKFMVTQQPGYWDNEHMHPVGSILEIEPAEYQKHLSVTFKGMDPEAEAALAKKRAGFHSGPEFVLPAEVVPNAPAPKGVKTLGIYEPTPTPVRITK